jgi:ATP-dependent RNA helicase DHX57
VFIHPASVCFSTGNFPSPWLVYHEKVATSRVFVRDVTVASPYALLLFGGHDSVAAAALGEADVGSAGAEGEAVRVEHADGLVYVGRYSWMKFKAPARLGVLVRGLRAALDELLKWKIAEPAVDIASSPVIDAVLRLLAGHGF